MNYPVVIHKERGTDYGVSVPDLPGCVSAGATVDEALAMVREAIELHLEGLIEAGGLAPLPTPIERLHADRSYAGGTWAIVAVDNSTLRVQIARIGVTMPQRVLDAIDRHAEASGETRSGLLARAAADLALAELDLRRHHVVSPVAGLVETREVVTGQELPPGAAVATVVRRDPMRVRFQVVESEAALLMPGQVVTFRVDGASATHAATIAQVAQAADPHTRQVSVQALVAGPTDGLRGNAFVRVECRPGTMRRAVVVPAAAVRPGERGFIAYVVAEGKAQERILTLGVHGDGGMEVRAGLAAGEELVMRGADSLRDGTLVRSATGSTP